MPKIVPVGPSTKLIGKTLWEILGNLKNFGVGRIVIRSSHERYAEPSYFRILKVEAMPLPKDEKLNRKVRAYTEQVFRGRKFEKIYEICHASWKPDYRLIPRAEEKALIEKAEAAALNIKTKYLPKTIQFPPLLKEFIMQDRVSKGLPTDEGPRLKLVIREENPLYKIAEEGEEPTEVLFDGKGRTTSPGLYEIPELFKKKLEN